MANSWFQFKQFKVHQDKTSMKVGTDGVLLGAWASIEGARQVIDIGTGTGLIALMLAQRNTDTTVEAVEIDEEAALQANQNFTSSPWFERLSIHQMSVQEFVENNPTKYDAIVCNPPFFVNSKKATGNGRILARHNDELSFDALIESVNILLTNGGQFSVILPTKEGEEFVEKMDQAGFFMSRLTKVIPIPNKAPKRLLMEFVRTATDCDVTELVIESHGRHQYSKEYKELTKDFYLFL